MDVFKSRFSAFLLFCKNFFQTVVIDFFPLRKQTKERFEMQFFGKEAFSLFSLLLLSLLRV
jgi:hypothetical protein